MGWVRIALAVIFLAVANLPAPADGPATIKVTGYGLTPADPGETITISVYVEKWPGGAEGKALAQSDDGSLTVTVTDSKTTPLPPDTYKVTLRTNDRRFATQIVHVGAGDKVEVLLDASKSMTYGYAAGQSFENAAQAKKDGRPDAYEKSAADIRDGIAQDERLVNEAQAASDAFAGDNGLRVTNLAGAEKDLNKLKKLGENADPVVKGNLERYIEKLKAVDRMRQDLNTNKQRFAELEQRSFGMVLPGACPQGQGGGLLAGSLNSLFGTDLAGVCDDDGDRDRHNGSQGGKEKEAD
jgi:hypothetical protein